MTHDLRTPSGVKSPTVILMTRTRVDCQSSSEDRYEAVCWRRAGEANGSDMGTQLDHADDDGLLRDRPSTVMGCCVLSGEHTLSEEQKADARRVQIWSQRETASRRHPTA